MAAHSTVGSASASGVYGASELESGATGRQESGRDGDRSLGTRFTSVQINELEHLYDSGMTGIGAEYSEKIELAIMKKNLKL